MTPRSERTWYRAFAFTLVMMASVGMIDRVYPPILPSMLDHNWLSKSQAGYVASASSIGVLLGVFICVSVAKRFNLGKCCRIFLVLGLISLLLSAINLGPWWLGANRLLTGISISGTSITTAILITQGVQRSQRGLMIGLIGLGAGLGQILISLTLPLPVISLESGPTIGWLYSCALAAICIIIAWPGIKTRQNTIEFNKTETKKLRQDWRLILLTASYALSIIGCTPVYIYLSAFVHQEYDLSVGLSAMTYAVAGVGVAIGGFIFNYLIIRLYGRHFSLIMAMACGLASSAAFLLFHDLWIALAASFIIAIVHSGVSALKTHNILELAGPIRQVHWQNIFKIVAATSLAVGAFMCGLLLQLELGYESLFIMSSISFAVALLISSFITFPSYNTTPT